MQLQGDCDQYPALAQVQRPLLPPTKAIRPYLDRIDEARWYSNRGPLLWELERRLYTHFGVDDHVVVLLSSGSAALEAGILAHAGAAQPRRPLALMPSYTFAATAASAARCGYEPYFLDVDPQDWMLDPKALAAHPMLDRAGLVVPVAAYGRRPDMDAWAAFQAQTGCSVVVDAAAAFEKFEQDPGLISDTVPAVLSLHATKTFSTAEGGAVLWRDADGQRRVGRVSNFGLSDARSCLSDGFNGKLSEYHAAVGLAQLDLWQERQADLTALTDLYRAAAHAGPLPGVLRLRPEVSGAYVLLDCFGPDAAVRVTDALDGQGIAWRRWYGKGLHLEPTHARRGHDPMPVTERLSQCHIGLPAAVDLSARDVARVTETLLGVN